MLMLLLLFLAVLTTLVLHVWLSKTEKIKGVSYRNSKWENLYIARNVGLAVTAGMMLITVWFGFYVNNEQIKANNKLDKLRQDRIALQQYKENVENNIRESLAKYPGIEKNQLKDINPTILLNYPKLRSSETLTAEFNALTRLDDKLLANRKEVIGTKNDIQNRKDSPYNIGLLYVN